MEEKKDRHKIGKYARSKGKRGELDWVHFLKENGFPNARRSVQYNGRPGTAADVVGLQYLHMEVKNVERLNIRKAMEQAERDSEAEYNRTGWREMPVVIHKNPRHGWLVTMNALDFLALYKAYAPFSTLREERDNED